MKSGLYLGRWFGIDVIVHWTFLLLVGLLMATQLLTGAAWAAVAGSTTLLVAVFLCVLLHEFGHALTANGCWSAPPCASTPVTRRRKCPRGTRTRFPQEQGVRP